jgi:succinate dehydrogenase hydrophobic anchor subunit
MKIPGKMIKTLLFRAIKSGFLGWLLHRITAIILIITIFIHIFYFNYVVFILGEEPVSGINAYIFYDIMLLSGLYHGLNGLKTILAELGFGLKQRVRLDIFLLIIWIVLAWFGSALLWRVFVGW